MPLGSINVWRKEIPMSKFAHLTLHVMRGLDPRIHEEARRRKTYVVVAAPWIAGSSPAMTNVRFWRNEPKRPSSISTLMPALVAGIHVLLGGKGRRGWPGQARP
jgi:hypothetical protein